MAGAKKIVEGAKRLKSVIDNEVRRGAMTPDQAATATKANPEKPGPNTFEPKEFEGAIRKYLKDAEITDPAQRAFVRKFVPKVQHADDLDAFYEEMRNAAPPVDGDLDAWLDEIVDFANHPWGT